VIVSNVNASKEVLTTDNLPALNDFACIKTGLVLKLKDAELSVMEESIPVKEEG
jgi:hypothetical protein